MQKKAARGFEIRSGDHGLQARRALSCWVQLLISTFRARNCEVAVGPFSADILPRDLSNNSLVVIENQLERTNHDHFGKTLTYAAVLGARTVIWVAKAFTDEHRQAIELAKWLTERAAVFNRSFGPRLQAMDFSPSLTNELNASVSITP